MAIIYDGIKCPICGQEIDINEPFFATSGVFFSMDDPLFEFCDAALHWSCYEHWPHRGRFAKQYVDMWAYSVSENPYWFLVERTAKYFIQVNPDEPVSRIDLFLYETGSDVSINLSDWNHWISSQRSAISGLYSLEARAVSQIYEELAAKFPNRDALLASVNRT
jgi:hypothetical protein